VVLAKEGQKANWSKRPLPQKLLDYAALDVFHLPALRNILRDELQQRGRLAWQEQRCRWQIDCARSGFPRNDEHAWRIGRSERLGPRGQCALWAVWHWREETALRLDQPPFKITSNDFLIEIASRADAGLPEEAILALDLGRRHPRLIASLTEAVRTGLAKNPSTLRAVIAVAASRAFNPSMPANWRCRTALSPIATASRNSSISIPR